MGPPLASGGIFAPPPLEKPQPPQPFSSSLSADARSLRLPPLAPSMQQASRSSSSHGTTLQLQGRPWLLSLSAFPSAPAAAPQRRTQLSSASPVCSSPLLGRRAPYAGSPLQRHPSPSSAMAELPISPLPALKIQRGPISRPAPLLSPPHGVELLRRTSVTCLARPPSIPVHGARPPLCSSHGAAHPLIQARAGEAAVAHGRCPAQGMNPAPPMPHLQLVFVPLLSDQQPATRSTTPSSDSNLHGAPASIP
jgi:hypothetical protein